MRPPIEGVLALDMLAVLGPPPSEAPDRIGPFDRPAGLDDALDPFVGGRDRDAVLAVHRVLVLGVLADRVGPRLQDVNRESDDLHKASPPVPLDGIYLMTDAPKGSTSSA